MTGQRPVLAGYTITANDDGGWDAQHDRLPDIRFSGRNQRELDRARGAALAQEIAAMRQAFARTDPSGYPRGGSPPF